MLANQQIIFIDSQVGDYQLLANGVLAGIEVVVLKSDRDGIEQITEVLNQRNNYASIHIVSHGSPGCLYLGNTQLSLDTLNQYQNDLETWFSSSFLIYGCNVAAGDAGEEFITKLHNITGAEIAASSTPIGSADLGGNWKLNAITNNVSHQLAFDHPTQESYQGVFGVITGHAFLDFNNDGQKRAADSGDRAAEDVGVEGITVTAYYSDNTTETVTTDSTGEYSLSNSGNLAARVEFSNVPQSYQSTGLAGADTATVSSVFFIEAGVTADTTANLGLFNPDNFLEDGLDPRLITTCFILGGFSGSTDTGIVSVLHTASGLTPTKTDDAEIGEVASLYGLAYNKETKDLFAGTFQKRFSDVGTGANGNDNGTGVIYRITNVDNANSGDNSVGKFIDLNEYYRVYNNETDVAGAYSHGDSTQPTGNSADDRSGIDWEADKDSFDAVTKVGFGDVEISGDRQNIWTINLADRQLYKVEIGDGSNYTYDAANPDARTVERFDINSNLSGLETGTVLDDIRPFALAEKDGLIYIGMVNSAESTGVTGDLHAYIYTFDPETEAFSNAPVVDFALDYERQDKVANIGIDQSANWGPWVNSTSNNEVGNDPNSIEDDFNLSVRNGNRDWVDETQPILSDIAFDNNGDMILGFRDRTGDQVGAGSLDLDGNGSPNGFFDVGTGGDLLRATLDSGGTSWTIESGVSDIDPDTEIYDEERFEYRPDNADFHAETAQGGVTQIPGFTSVETTAFDPINGTADDGVNAGGILGLENTNINNAGDATRGIQLFQDAGTPGIGKANGLGDLEAITTLSPIEVGDRIWNDADGNGIQDPGESGISGVEVKLFKDGSEIGSTTTDGTGEYSFGGVTDANIPTGEIEPNTNYYLQISDGAGNPTPLNGLNLTLANQGDADNIDSDAIDIAGTPTIAFTTEDYGDNDYDLDAGFTSTPVTQDFDFGDAPDTIGGTAIGDYQTVGTDGGAAHVINSSLFLGTTTTDADNGTQQNTATDADDTLDGNDDETGVVFTTTDILTTDTSFTANITATNNSGSNATLIGWIDLDKSGTFDADEAVTTTINDGNTNLSTSLTWNSLGDLIPSDITSGDTYARFRLTTDTITTADSVGALGDGEVEDYQLNIVARDYGDAPDDGVAGNSAGDYNTVSGNSGAAHNIVTGLSLGTAVDADTGTAQNTSANADDITADDDEDGITSFAAFDKDNDDSYSVSVNVTNSTTSPSTLVGWIDFNQNGLFESSEGIEVPLAASSGTSAVNLTFDRDNGTNGNTGNTYYGVLPNAADIVAGTTYARFRLSDDTVNLTNATPNGLIGNGEVEDYTFTIEGGTDFGDAPDDYKTLDASGGASHNLVSGLSIGGTVDDESDGVPNTDADGDDEAGIDDEDGVTFVDSKVIAPNDTSYSVDVIVNAPSGTTTTTLASDDFSRDNNIGGDALSAYKGGSDWASDWVGYENIDITGVDPDADAGKVRVNEIDNSLEITDNGRAAERKIDLSGTTGNVILNFNYQELGTINPGDDPLEIYISNDDGENFTLVESYTANADSPTSIPLDITSDITRSANTIIRFRVHPITLDAGNGYSIFDVNVTETTSTETTLVSWIDFDGDNTFAPSEGVSLSTTDGNPLVTDGITPNTLTWDRDGTGTTNNGNGELPVSLTSGDTYARFRLSTDSNLSTSTPDDSVTDIDDGEVEDYKLTIAELDYGDAPDTDSNTGVGNYQTTASDGGAAHAIVSGLSIGSNAPDADDGTLQNTAADADDDSNTGSVDDEDGVASFDSITTTTTSYSVDVAVANTLGAATLIGWIDFDGNGAFEADEATSISIPTNSTSPVTLDWNTIPAGITGGETYARFRLSTDFNGISIDDTTSVGTVGDGEVEDYRLFIEGGIDYGDAPDDGTNGSYSTSITNSGVNAANHGIVDGLSIGDTVDSDDGTLQNSTADADDNNGTDDEDGIVTFDTLETSADSYSVTVDVTNTGAAATLFGWIDFDGNGVFDADEAVSTTVSNSDPVTLTWNDANIPADIAGGDTFARFRLSRDPDLSASLALGALDDGEVEDYQLTIAEVKDFGDAPDTTTGTSAGDYQTTTTNSGTDAPSHIIVDGLSLGTNIDGDDGSQANTDATADDNDVIINDEDGVDFTTAGTSFNSDAGTYSVDVNIVNDNNQDVTVVGWIDFDQSGTFDADEAVSQSISTSNSSLELEWSDFPTDIVAGNTFARFRLSSDENLTTAFSTGELSDGEIEDYQVTINGIDYGDAPDANGDRIAGNYDTTVDTDAGTTDEGGAAHTILSGLNIGTTVDADTGTAQNTGATADDNNSTDDEDGITLGALSVGDTTYSVTVDVEHTTGANATLIGWIDFNGNGQFEASEASTLIANTNLDSSGEPVLTWNVPTNANDIKGGTTYARIRLSDGTLTDATSTGLIGNGEVEDYQITIEGGTDFGDATQADGTDPYSTETTSHGIVDGISIGDTVDSELSVTPNTDASTDDDTGSGDEDGVDFIDTKVISTSDTSYSVEVIVNSTGGTGTTTIASDDFSSGNYTGGSSDGNGSDWDGAWTEGGDDGNSATGNVRVNGEVLQVYNDGRSASRTLTIPTTATGTINLSFDYAQASGTGGTNGASRQLGAGDDLTVAITANGTTTNITVPYSATSGSGTRIIDLINETSVTPGSTATIEFNTDEIGGVDNDDGYDIDNVTITSESTLDTTLVGWVDFDRNGTFDTDEGYSLSTDPTKSTDGTILNTNGTTPNTINWTNVDTQTSGITPGDTYARFRLTTDDLTTNATNSAANEANAVGTLTDGEVEDYALKIKNEVTGTGASEEINDSSTDPTTANDDFITAGAGQDTLTGGAGDDCYHFNITSDGIDVITDFSDSGNDKLDFSDIFNNELNSISIPANSNPFDEGYVEAIAFGTGVMIVVDEELGKGGDDALNKAVVLLRETNIADIDATDFIF